MPVTSHQQLLLDAGEQPCSAEWCPDAAAASVLAVGTYQLDEASRQRLGKLLMYRLVPPDGDSSAPPQLLPLSSLALPGIFDLRWHPRSAMPQLAAALADGSVRLLAFGKSLEGGGSSGSDSSAAAAPPEATVVPGGEEAAEGMAVSVDYARAAGFEGEQLVTSFSSGQLQLWQAAPAGLTSLASWQAHQLEAWAAAFDYWNPSLIHSGGDDCAYRLWDSRQGFDAPAWQSSKAHGAGVCCASSSPHREHLVCTGSYDDRLRLWDVRSPKRPLQRAEVNTGGGVWRAKWHPSNPELLLAACMYNGFAVLRAAAAESGGLEILESYEHASGSLSYGADWCRDEAAAGGSGASLAATASFYDRQLHLWSYCA
ncbi:diphthine methyltransferase-like protein [Chlorella sorokiniana]|uniref:methylated diphthine methylhydrolase n=1 Tax=Chlorella sorokiniana TaxID=3076 RepID=A0A2P6U518_CHLSO|nr:diphthine methyltransferase-like protein [Chlorella sorokiniana]|eukprot:PRW61418.1 diphthine methyltransferase-like protein [Chlorella sorokiniana]